MNDGWSHFSLAHPDLALDLPVLTLKLVHDVSTVVHSHSHAHEQVHDGYAVELHAPEPHRPRHRTNHAAHVRHHQYSGYHVVEHQQQH